LLLVVSIWKEFFDEMFSVVSTGGVVHGGAGRYGGAGSGSGCHLHRQNFLHGRTGKFFNG
jgi:hypothetical protein